MPKAYLRELFAQHFGVVHEARLALGDGFNVLTGETGAGKTLLVDALGLALGADTAGVRHALSSDTRVVALFEVDDKEVLVVREADAAGRLRSSLDGAPSSAEALKALGATLLVIHGQHESVSLAQRSQVLERLDRFGSVNTDLLSATRRELLHLEQLREELGGGREAREREASFLRFQLEELEEAELTSETELDEVLERLIRLSALRDDQSALEAVLQAFDGDDQGAIFSQFAQTLARLPSGSTYEEVRSVLAASLISARDALGELRAMADPDAVDGAAIERLELRAQLLQQLVRKHGSLRDALALSASSLVRLALLEQDEDRLRALDQEIETTMANASVLAATARGERQRAAVALNTAVAAQLPRVALARATLRFVVDGDDGSDVRVLFAANPGQREGPLGALASGGELSRILLAISLVTADDDLIAVFDEVDAGLGGQVAQQIGDCLHEVGQEQQVLAITHLASVAARADHHFVVEKLFANGVTSTSLREVHGDDRVDEVARMLAGDDLTPQSRALARQLIENSDQVTGEVTIAR